MSSANDIVCWPIIPRSSAPVRYARLVRMPSAGKSPTESKRLVTPGVLLSTTSRVRDRAYAPCKREGECSSGDGPLVTFPAGAFGVPPGPLDRRASSPVLARLELVPLTGGWGDWSKTASNPLDDDAGSTTTSQPPSPHLLLIMLPSLLLSLLLLMLFWFLLLLPFVSSLCTCSGSNRGTKCQLPRRCKRPMPATTRIRVDLTLCPVWSQV